MILRRLYDDRLAQAAYLIGCAAAGEAVVVDPSRDVEPYLDAAAAEGLRIAHVTETHIHADFVREPASSRRGPGHGCTSRPRAGPIGSTASPPRMARSCCVTATASRSARSGSTWCTRRGTPPST